MSKKKKDTSHVVTVCRDGDNKFLCQHCGGVERFDLPMPLDEFPRRALAFVKRHADCPKQDHPRDKNPVSDFIIRPYVFAHSGNCLGCGQNTLLLCPKENIMLPGFYVCWNCKTIAQAGVGKVEFIKDHDHDDGEE